MNMTSSEVDSMTTFLSDVSLLIQYFSSGTVAGASGDVRGEVDEILSDVDVEVRGSVELNGRSGWNRLLLPSHDHYDELSSMSLEHRKNQGRFKNVKHEAGFLKSSHAWAY